MVEEKKDNDDIYMNRPVISKKELSGEEELIILLADEVPENVKGTFPDNSAVYWSDSLEINSDLETEKIIVYGIGDGAVQLNKVLGKRGIEPELYCVTKKKILYSMREKR